MNFKEFLNENDKLKGFKSFLNSRDVARISNNYSEQEERDHLNKTYGDNTIQNRAEAFGVNYDELVKAFGMPPKIIEDPNTGQITYEWLVWFKDGATAAVVTYVYSGGSKLEDKKYWAVSGTDPADLVARIKRYIKSKGGKLLGENNKLAGLKSINNLIQFEVTKDPDFYKTGFTTRGSFISTLNDLQDVFGFPLLATAHGEDIDVKQNTVRFAYWGLSFKNGLKIIIMPGIYSSVRDHLINPTVTKRLYINPRIQSINSQEERWYVLTPKESNIPKKEIQDRLSFALGVIVENNKLAGLKSFVDSMGIVKISNDFTPNDISKLLAQTYPDLGADYTQVKVKGFHINYEELVEVFGMPPKQLAARIEGETEYKWLIWFKDGILASVSAFIFPNMDTTLENIKYWVVSAQDAEEAAYRIKTYIKSKGGKLLKENNKLAALKSFVTSDQIINAKLKAPAIETVQELERLPEKSIIWYPEHDLRVGTCITKDILLDYIKHQKKIHGSSLRKAWDVYLNGKLIDTVFTTRRRGYVGNEDKEDVLRDLIDHDGYDPNITIESEPEITPEIETKIENFAKEFNAIKEYKGDDLAPAVSVADEPMDFEADEDELDFNKYPEDYINFVTKAIQKGYKFYQVAYERKFDPNNIRHWWRLLD